MSRVLLTLFAVFAGFIILAFLLDRGHPLNDPVVPQVDIETLDADLAAREAAFDDLKPEVAARVVWANEPGDRTDIVLLYLHGFSATSEELRPVPDMVARSLGANLVFWRLPGHGRSGDAMAEPLPQDWLDSTALAIATADAIGQRVIVMGTSTGGTLAARAAVAPGLADMIDAVVFVSPNFRLKNPQEGLLTLPGSEFWVPLVAGRERGFEPRNEAHAYYWTMRYPTVAVQRLAWLMRRVRALDFSEAQTPALFLFSDSDQVVDAVETRRVASAWGGPTTLSPQTVGSGDDPRSHVLAGDIISPGMTGIVTDQVLDWIDSL